MSLVTADHVEQMIRAATGNLNTQIIRLTEQLNVLNPIAIEPFQPVQIDPNVNSTNFSLDLIKSLPEFDGNPASYPAWRSAASFAMEYYPENSEKSYVATGILRNKVTGSANTTISSYNTVLNFKAILARLDQTYADKRPLHVLENELSILRQDNLTIGDFYDQVDKQLTLIINKQMMSFHGQDALVATLIERARENALRVFISGLRRPLCDILFSAKPSDLPTALATAQELEVNRKRNDFAMAYAAGNNAIRSNKLNFNKSSTPRAPNLPRPTPMDIESSKIVHQSSYPQNFNLENSNNRNRQNFQNQSLQQSHIQNSPGYYQPRQNPNTGAIPKRLREAPDSNRSRFYKQQRINYMPDDDSNEIDNSDCQSERSDVEDDISTHEINFLE